MKRTCSNGVLDFDAINAFRPDGEKIFCQFTAAGYGAGTDGRSDGPFVQTDDTGLVRLRDMAFKMLCDLCIRAGIDSMRFLYAEASRGAARDDVPDGRLPLGGAGDVPDALASAGMTHVMLPDLSLALACNLDIFEEYDAYSELRALAAGFEPLSRLVRILDGFLYIPYGRGSFIRLLDGMEELMGSLPADDLRMFANAFYGALNEIRPIEFSGASTMGRMPSPAFTQPLPVNPPVFRAPAPEQPPAVTDEAEQPDAEDQEQPDAENQDGQPDATDDPGQDGQDDGPAPADASGQDGNDEAGTGPADTGVPASESGTDADKDDTLPAEDGAGAGAAPAPAGSHVKGVSVGALVGADETYTSDYESERYDKALEQADPEGLLDATVKSRANGTDGPIDVLTLKATVSQAFKPGDVAAEREAQNLREHLGGLRKEAVDAAGGEDVL